MAKLNLYSILLLLISWIPLSGQPGVKDTIKCYGLKELQQIAQTAVNLSTCGELLTSKKAQLANRDTLIKEKNLEIAQLNTVISVKNQQIKLREDSIATQVKIIKKLNRHKKWITAGWITTSVIQLGLLLYVIIILVL